jgi:hypothetical protein
MNETNEPTEPSYLDKLRARELKDTKVKQEDTENDDENREEDNGKGETR